MTDRRHPGTAPSFPFSDEHTTVVPNLATEVEGQRLTETDSAVAFFDEQTFLKQRAAYEMVSPDMILGPADETEHEGDLGALFDDKTDLDTQYSQLHRHVRRVRESPWHARRVLTRPSAHLSSTASGQGRAESVG